MTRTPGDNGDDALGDDDLYEPALRRALAHAPDHAAVPKFHVSKSIRQLAHDAIGPSDEEMTAALDRPWWRQLFGGGKSLMPWNAAFATVLVGVLVTFLWQREPVPGPQLDRPAPSPAAVPAPAAKSTAPAAEVAAPAQAPPSEPTIALPPTVAEAPVLPPAPPTPEIAPLPFQLDLPPPAPPPPLPPARRDAPAASAAESKKSSRAEQAAGAGFGSAEREAAARARPPVAPAAASLSAPAPARVPGVANDAAGAASSAMPDLPRQPTFAALSQWTRLTVVPANGETRSFGREDGRQLGVLVGSAALAAVGQQPLRSRVEWRITLERDGKPLAQLEMARGEVRWRENGMPATTGQPPEGALDGLRDALRELAAPAQQAPAGLAPAPAEAPR